MNMGNVKWIKITTDIFSDEKILLIEKMPDADSLIVIWFKLLCMAGRENNCGVFMMANRMPYTEEMLATIFRRPINTVRLALSTFEAFGMIDIEDDIIVIPNWEKHQNIEGLEKIREQTRLRVAKHREKQKQTLLDGVNTADNNNSVTVTLRNATEEEKNKNKNKNKKKESKKENTRTIYERLLPDYTISDALKSKLDEWITYKEERKEAYVEQGMKSFLRKIENNYMKHGEQALCDLIDDCMSSGYKGIIFDKLKNKAGQQVRKEMVPRWMQGEKQNYDFEALERDLLANNNPVTVKDDPKLAAKAEALKEQLGGAK